MLDFNPMQMMIIGAIAVLLFGERLPEVSRTVGKQIMQLKKGIRGIQDEVMSAINTAGNSSSSSSSSSSSYNYDSPPVYDEVDREEATAPKFEPPPGDPAPSPPASAPPAASPAVASVPAVANPAAAPEIKIG